MTGLHEAFQRMALFEEEDSKIFSADADGLSELGKYLDNDDVAPTDIIDLDAEEEEELQDDYMGKTILECPICHSLIYKDDSEIDCNDEENDEISAEDIENEDGDTVCKSIECPYCFSHEGFKIIGKVAPFNPSAEAEFELEKEEEDEMDADMEDESPMDDGEVSPMEDELEDGDYYDEEYEEEDMDESLLKENRFDRNFPDAVKRDIRRGLSSYRDELGGIHNASQRGVGYGLMHSKKRNGFRDYKDAENYQNRDRDAYNSFLRAKFDDKEEEIYDETGVDPIHGPIMKGRQGRMESLNRKARRARRNESLRMNPVKKTMSPLAEAIRNVEFDTDEEHISFGQDENGNVTFNTTPLDGTEDGIEMPGDDLADGQGIELVNGDEDKMIAPLTDAEKDDIDNAVDANSVDVETDIEGDDIPDEEMPIEGGEEATGDLAAGEDTFPAEGDEGGVSPLAAELGGEEDTTEEEEEPQEFDNESFDRFTNQYLKGIYENVNSYTTTSITKNVEGKYVIEGVIAFNSGKNKKTTFVFEQVETGKGVSLLGENVNICSGKKAFRIPVSFKEGKIVCESLKVNYVAKDSDGNATRVLENYR